MIDYSNFTVIVPTLNEAETIATLLTQLRELYPSIVVIVADDESSDDTAKIVQEVAIKTTNITFYRRTGKQHGLTASVIDALGMVKTEYFMVMDGDLQHPPKVLAALMEKLEAGNEIVVGARIPYKENQGLHRIVMTRVATKLAKVILNIHGLKVSDPMSGLFAGKTALVQQAITAHPKAFEPRGYKVFFELLKTMPKTLKYDEVFYQFAFRSSGKSKLGVQHLFYFLRSLFK